MINRVKLHKIRHFRIRKKIVGTESRPRLTIFRSGKHIYAQIINDIEGRTLVAESDLKVVKASLKQDKAFEIGKRVAEKALKEGIKTVAFDRGGYIYHGRVEKVAVGAREGGLKF